MDIRTDLDTVETESAQNRHSIQFFILLRQLLLVDHILQSPTPSLLLYLSTNLSNFIMTTVAPGTKIIDILSKPTADGNPYVSLEYFPPRTDDGVKVCA
jgi:hypothetical protein